MNKIIEISLERYEELIKAEHKAEQYKNAILANTSNNQFVKIMTCIESKNLYELLSELKEEK